MSKIKVTQIRSKIGREKKQHAVLDSLGLKKLGQTVEKEDTPAIRGMIHKVKHLVEVTKTS